MTKEIAEKTKTCSVSALAELLGITPRRVTELVRENIIPAPDKDHRYDWLRCNHAYIAFWKGKTAATKSKVNDELKAVELEQKKFKLGVQRGMYIARQDVVNELVKRVYVLKSDLLSLERRMPPQSKEKEIVKKFVRNLLNVYSQRTGPFRENKKI
jgi:predicted HTH domain antitoxin